MCTLGAQKEDRGPVGTDKGNRSVFSSNVPGENLQRWWTHGHRDVGANAGWPCWVDLEDLKMWASFSFIVQYSVTLRLHILIIT